MNFNKSFIAGTIFLLSICCLNVKVFAVDPLDGCTVKNDTSAYLDLQIKVMLEGAYQSNGMMHSQLLTRNLLPNVQPYYTAPWNYNGLEGNGWTAADYPPNTVDWVKVSFRATVAKSTEIAATAGVLFSDGTIFFPNTEVLQFMFSGVYIYIQHRNHMAIMSPNKIVPQNGVLTYDFTTQNSYTDGAGQKQISPNKWVMFAGDGDQINDIASDINGKDQLGWVSQNGIFNFYNSFDYDMDGDINGSDRALWSINNGTFSSIFK